MNVEIWDIDCIAKKGMKVKLSKEERVICNRCLVNGKNPYPRISKGKKCLGWHGGEMSLTCLYLCEMGRKMVRVEDLKRIKQQFELECFRPIFSGLTH